MEIYNDIESKIYLLGEIFLSINGGVYEKVFNVYSTSSAFFNSVGKGKNAKTNK